jgi:hypothetical protein
MGCTRTGLAAGLRFLPDISYLRFEWSARFCRNGDGWLWQKDDPGLTATDGGSATGPGQRVRERERQGPVQLPGAAHHGQWRRQLHLDPGRPVAARVGASRRLDASRPLTIG